MQKRDGRVSAAWAGDGRQLVSSSYLVVILQTLDITGHHKWRSSAEATTAIRLRYLGRLEQDGVADGSPHVMRGVRTALGEQALEYDVKDRLVRLHPLTLQTEGRRETSEHVTQTSGNEVTTNAKPLR